MPILSFVAVFLCGVAAACPAALAAPGPAGGAPALNVSITLHNDQKLTAAITLKNDSAHGIGIGRFVSYAVSKTDVSPPQTVLSSPPNQMQPHFRRLLQPGDQVSSTMTLSEKPLPAGKYELTITYPRDMLPEPVRKAFEIPTATQPR